MEKQYDYKRKDLNKEQPTFTKGCENCKMRPPLGGSCSNAACPGIPKIS